MQRRSFLALSLGAILTGAVPARARTSTGKLKSATREAHGTTLRLALDNAPFPCAGSQYFDPTVIVFVPDSFRPEGSGRRRRHADRRGSVPLLVHFHGHRTSAERALLSHELREQLIDSKQNAILVVPQGPLMAADSACGKLETPHGLSRMLNEVLDTLAAEAASILGPAGVSENDQLGTVCLSAHSGGYHAAAACLRHGGVEVNEVYLFDALYGEADTFRDWVIAGKGKLLRQRHKLVSYYGAGTTQVFSQWLRAELAKADVRIAYEEVEGTLTREEFSRGEAVFVRTQVSHGEVTHELNQLRDCLYASGLPRHIRTAWFDNKTDPRALDRRRRDGIGQDLSRILARPTRPISSVPARDNSS